MTTFEDAFDLPVSIQVNGHAVSVPKLTNVDYFSWIEELTQQLREREKAAIPATMKPSERQQTIANIEAFVYEPGHLKPFVRRAKESIRFIEMALTKAGVSPEAAKAFIDSQPVYKNIQLAARLSGLYSSTEFAEAFNLPQKPPDPNMPKGERGQAAETTAG